MPATSKTTKTKPVMDVSRPAKAADVPEKLVIESRPLIDHDETPAADAGSDIEAKPEDKSTAAEAAKADTPVPTPAPAPSATKKVVTPPTLSAPEAASTPDTTESTEETEAAADTPTDDLDASPAEEATKTQRDKDAEETKKAVEQARRDQEVKEYIENKQFFVPINEVARKRSIKVSFGLVLLMAILAVVLIDLMLDSGLILLLQKIPHTNFFST